jgi:hypothetical protein
MAPIFRQPFQCAYYLKPWGIGTIYVQKVRKIYAESIVMVGSLSVDHGATETSMVQNTTIPY